MAGILKSGRKQNEVDPVANKPIIGHCFWWSGSLRGPFSEVCWWRGSPYVASLHYPSCMLLWLCSGFSNLYMSTKVVSVELPVVFGSPDQPHLLSSDKYT